MKRIFCALLSAAAAVALLCAFAPLEQQNGDSDPIVKSYETAEAVESIIICDKSASLVVEAADVDHVVVEYSYNSAYASAFDPGEPLYRFTLADRMLTIEKTKNPEETLWPIRKGGNDRWCQLTVRLPRREYASLTADTNNGSIQVNGLSVQTAALSSSNGDILLNNVSGGTVTVSASNGKLELTDLALQGLTASTRNGSICLTDLSSQSIDARTSNGSIKLSAVASPSCQYSAENGSISGTMKGRGTDFRYDLQIGSGRITLLDDTDNSFALRSSQSVQHNLTAAQSIAASAKNGNISLGFLG